MNLGTLTDEQREAARAPDRPLLIRAGAGAGKTTTMVARGKVLVRERGVRPEQVLMLAYSKAAGRATRERLQRTMRAGDEVVRAIQIGTFHSFGLGIVREHWRYFGFRFSPPKQALRMAEARELLAEAAGRAGWGQLDGAGLAGLERKVGAARAGKAEHGFVPDVPDLLEVAPLVDLYEALILMANRLDYLSML